MEADFPHVLENTAHKAAFNPGPWRKDQLQGAGPTLGQAGELNGGGGVMPFLERVAAGTLEAQPPRGCLSMGRGPQQGCHYFLSSQNPTSPVGLQLLEVGSTEKENYICTQQGSHRTHGYLRQRMSGPRMLPHGPGPPSWCPEGTKACRASSDL